VLTSYADAPRYFGGSESFVNVMPLPSIVALPLSVLCGGVEDEGGCTVVTTSPAGAYVPAFGPTTLSVPPV
jgi:hypothetical protein